jgi:hypothetical protein
MNDLESLEGLFVGQLSPYEHWLFHNAVRDNLAYVDYVGASGFLGLGRIRIKKELCFDSLRRK